MAVLTEEEDWDIELRCCGAVNSYWSKADYKELVQELWTAYCGLQEELEKYAEVL